MNEMTDIIGWLLKLETLAGEFYGEAARRLEGDEGLYRYFLHLQEEEASHFQVMEEALEYMQRHAVPPPAIVVDEDTRRDIEENFERGLELLRTGSWSMDDLFRCLAMTEFSEWNDIFMYVVNTVKEERRFMPVAASMHHNITEITHFLESLPAGRPYLNIVNGLPRVWKEQILIVEDDGAIAQFLKRLLSDFGQVETAVNGSEGLRKVKEKYFDVIVSDVQMPVMDGLEFYRESSAVDSAIGERILFFTGSPSETHIEFFRVNALRYLRKPAPIREIVRRVAEIIPAAAREG